MASLASTEDDKEGVLYTLVGSQFGAKALVALDALNVPYRVYEVDVTKMKEQLEPPHTVPQFRFHGRTITDRCVRPTAADAHAAAAPTPPTLPTRPHLATHRPT